MSSLSSRMENSSSAPARSTSDGMTFRLFHFVGCITSAICFSPRRTGYIEMPGVFSSPSPSVAWACGSRSTTSTALLRAESAAARLTTVVVLPTPPFWFAIAITFVLLSILCPSFMILKTACPFRRARGCSCPRSARPRAATAPRERRPKDRPRPAAPRRMSRARR